MFQVSSRSAAAWTRSVDECTLMTLSKRRLIRTASRFYMSHIKKTVSICECTALARLVEIRAAQRTFEGAYMRTALSQFSFALVVLKIFTSEFYAIGALFAAYGAAVMLCAVYRRYEGNRQFFSATDGDGETVKKFRTSGNSLRHGLKAARKGGERAYEKRTKLSSGFCVEVIHTPTPPT
ncbi:hypothetical protein DL769_007935 [Monosporascus sp. CRB-8-3]|nr:hypothetical protein DL769_007935 [Monosporascus sp. CRB-8-3]